MVQIAAYAQESNETVDAAQQEFVARTVLGESSVWGLLGYRRRGKGVYGSIMCWQAALKGVRILHLGNLTFGEQINPVELANQSPGDLGNCLLFIDESRLVLPSVRTGTIFQLLVSSNLVQSGHQGLSVLWTAQFERGIARDITEQTDWILNINSAKRRWTTDRDIEKGRVPPEKDNRCDAWRPDSPFHRAHTGFAINGTTIFNDCRSADKQFTIVADIVTQWGNPLGPGRRQTHVLHCAQRFFPLSKTTHKVDAMSALLLSADQLREQKDQEMVADIHQLLLQAHLRGHSRIIPANLTAFLEESLAARYPGVSLSRNKMGSIMTFLGVPKIKHHRVMYYDLEGWNKDADQADMESTGNVDLFEDD